MVVEHFRYLRLAAPFIVSTGMFFGTASAEVFSISSPDHPPAWYNRAGDKLSQTLSWNNSKQELCLTVAYSSIAATSFVWRDQTYVDSFNLTFPMVRLDRSTNRLYFMEKGTRVEIGRLESSFFGSRVILDDDVALSAHRRNGYVEATITVGEEIGR
jgi:hypothetical protein